VVIMIITIHYVLLADMMENHCTKMEPKAVGSWWRSWTMQ